MIFFFFLMDGLLFFQVYLSEVFSSQVFPRLASEIMFKYLLQKGTALMLQ